MNATLHRTLQRLQGIGELQTTGPDGSLGSHHAFTDRESDDDEDGAGYNDGLGLGGSSGRGVVSPDDVPGIRLQPIERLVGGAYQMRIKAPSRMTTIVSK